MKKEATTEYETINAPSAVPLSNFATDPSAVTTAPHKLEADRGTTSDSDDEPPELTPLLRQFSQIEISPSDPGSTFQKSFEFIQAHPEIYVEGAVDALLMEALASQLRSSKGRGTQAKKDAKYALQCVHQGLLIQYCEKLGKDGVRMFFRK